MLAATRLVLSAVISLSMIIPLSSIAFATGLSANPFIGSWQLESGKYLDDKGLWQDYDSLNLKAIKVLSASHFSFTTMKEVNQDGEVKDEFWAAGTGHYEFTDTRYIEYPALNSFGVAAGESFAFEYQIQGQELHTKRVEDGVLKEVEVWQRLD
ncbi:hypothetical protein FM038_007265 [Shewanella eurypsychrophilus]|uniref:Lipocalin-like domain-containing protein n=1 Tax=Shewanella eurypsychrophilus TaxID=2593656 RepID=A0ABX6V5X3_9GAMM|nr:MULTISPECIES: hypothetical protein [Shewanella]QFU21971.1 hypothetical protein FS418_08845 [Shewanella sp. YLB-09]QPG57260.1 hypothetical protein FM038_007265 [Shewanella eurypsychrophilus]